MDIFQIHSQIVADYKSYIRSFINIKDAAIRNAVESELEKGRLWPEPLIQFNPAFEVFGGVAEVAKQEKLCPEFNDIFKGFRVYRHKVEAIRLGCANRDFVVTSGTGSGKSLTYIASIFQHLIKNPQPQGIRAVIVYPMNALINSQFEEFQKFKANYEESTGKHFPISYGQYTGQEKEEQRVKIRDNPPDILLTNYMMLELILTRIKERQIRNSIYAQLRFLVFDELHTYQDDRTGRFTGGRPGHDTETGWQDHFCSPVNYMAALILCLGGRQGEGHFPLFIGARSVLSLGEMKNRIREMQLAEFKELEKENAKLEKVIAVALKRVRELREVRVKFLSLKRSPHRLRGMMIALRGLSLSSSASTP